MSKRETSKIIELFGRKFKIEKFDALTGSYIAFTIMERFLPLGLEAKAGLNGMPQNRRPMTRGEFQELQKDCLKAVCEVLPAGARPVIAENGNWGVLDIEKDTRLVILLTIQALAFNIADFFDGEGRTGLQEALRDILPASPRTSTPSPTAP